MRIFLWKLFSCFNAFLTWRKSHWYFLERQATKHSSIFSWTFRDENLISFNQIFLKSSHNKFSKLFLAWTSFKFSKVTLLVKAFQYFLAKLIQSWFKVSFEAWSHRLSSWAIAKRILEIFENYSRNFGVLARRNSPMWSADQNLWLNFTEAENRHLSTTPFWLLEFPRS